MGKTRYTKAKEFIDFLKKKYGDRVDGEDFKKESIMFLGGDIRNTLVPYLEMMRQLDMIEEKEEGVYLR